MAEYIERKEVLKHKRKMSGADFGGEFWDEAVLCEDIRKIPTADVVPVVRCKDCKHFRLYNGFKRGECGLFCELNSSMQINDYCSYGERRCDNDS